METLLSEIQTYLSNNGIGTAGTDLFISSLPGTPDDVVGIFDSSGLPPNKYILKWREPGIQILIRNTSYTAGKTKVESIYSLLHGKGDSFKLTAGGLDIVRIDAIEEPQALPEDESGRYLWTINFIFKIRDD